MTIKTYPVQSLSLNDVKQKFEHWRKTRVRQRDRIPEELWQAAITVFRSKNHTMNKIAKTLRLNQADLKRRIQHDFEIIETSTPPAFIEVKCDPNPVSISECIVEMEDIKGSKMKMHFRGKTDFDLLELGRSFWSKQA